MPNQQIFPQSTYPVTGDAQSQVGSPLLTVTGIQQTPFSATKPTAGQVPVMNSDGSWHPEDPVVSGADAPGSPSTANPVQISGIDDGSLVKELRVDTYGGIRSLRMEELLENILTELRLLKLAVVALDSTQLQRDFDVDTVGNSNL